MQRAIDLLQYKPKTFIGHDVYKLFKGFGVAHGKVIDQDFDKNGKPLWGVTYDDGVYEDYTRMDMEKYCIRQIHGTSTNPKSFTSHDQEVPLQESDSNAKKGTPTTCTTNPEPQASKKNTMDNPCTNIDLDNDHDAQFYTTKDNDTFFTICEAMGLPKAQQRLYYDCRSGDAISARAHAGRSIPAWHALAAMQTPLWLQSLRVAAAGFGASANETLTV